MSKWWRGVLGGAVAVGLLAVSGPAGAVGGPVKLLMTFDRCGQGRCAVRVPDDSGHGHGATVKAEAGGGLRAVRHRHGFAVRLSHANLQVGGGRDVDPGTRAFAFGVRVKTDAALVEGENLFQRGTYSDTPGVDQFKLQIDAGRQGCVIKGDDARVFDFAPADLPVDGRWHSVVCAVTPRTISYIVDGKAYRVANTAGPVDFPDSENVQIGGNFIADHNGDPVVHPIDDAFFAVGRGSEDIATAG